MIAPIIVSGTTSPDTIYCMFWGVWKPVPKLVRPTEHVIMGTDTGLRITPDCPAEWIQEAYDAYLLVLAGQVPPATHTIRWERYNPDPILTPIPVESGLFEMGGEA